MKYKDRLADIILLLVIMAGGVVLINLFFQAWTWAPWLLSSVSWNA